MTANDEFCACGHQRYHHLHPRTGLSDTGMRHVNGPCTAIDARDLRACGCSKFEKAEAAVRSEGRG